MSLCQNFQATIVFPLKNGYVLLGRKTRTVVVNRWNGWEGKVEVGESIRECAKRELRDESGLECDTNDLEYVAKVTFHNIMEEGHTLTFECHIFILRKWSGEFKPKLDEMKEPASWKIAKLPFREMAKSDRLWVPKIFSGHLVKGNIWLSRDQTFLLGDDLNVVERLDGID